MIFLLVNAAFLILSIGYVWLAGDRLDKQAAGWIAAALLGTLAATTWMDGGHAGLAVLAVDVALLAAIGRIALTSSRYWPTWFTGLHLAGVSCGAVALVIASQPAATLRSLAGFWSTAALLVMVFGLFLDRRAETIAQAKTQAQPST